MARATLSEPGFHAGRHYTDWVPDVKALRRAGRDAEAEVLLLRLVEATEREQAAEGWAIAPWYYEQLAIIHRKRGDVAAEIQILERFVSVSPPSGSPGSQALIERLGRARRRTFRAERRC